MFDYTSDNEELINDPVIVDLAKIDEGFLGYDMEIAQYYSRQLANSPEPLIVSNYRDEANQIRIEALTKVILNLVFEIYIDVDDEFEYLGSGDFIDYAATERDKEMENLLDSLFYKHVRHGQELCKNAQSFKFTQEELVNNKELLNNFVNKIREAETDKDISNYVIISQGDNAKTSFSKWLKQHSNNSFLNSMNNATSVADVEGNALVTKFVVRHNTDYQHDFQLVLKYGDTDISSIDFNHIDYSKTDEYIESQLSFYEITELGRDRRDMWKRRSRF